MDKNEVIVSLIGNLMKFHEIERNEKNNSVKFYAAFIAGGVAMIVGLDKLDNSIEDIFIKYLAISTIVIINFLILRKLIAVRIASNNIYDDYGRAVNYLMSELSTAENNDEISNIFKNYCGAKDYKRKLLPRHSADRLEIVGLSRINVLFSQCYLIPTYELLEYYGFVDANASGLALLVSSGPAFIFLILQSISIVVGMMNITSDFIFRARTGAGVQESYLE